MVVTTDVSDPQKYERKKGKVISRQDSLSLWSDACIRPKPRGLLPSGALVVHPIKNIVMKKAIGTFHQRKLCKTKENAFEPMLKHKYLTIASGATPIGSTGLAPDENSGREKKQKKKRRRCFHWGDIFEMINMIPSYILPSGALGAYAAIINMTR